MAKFLEICQLLAEDATARTALLPITTVFRLEYASKENISSLIKTYKDLLEKLPNADKKDLLAYACSLFLRVTHRGEPPNALNFQALNTVINTVFRSINSSQIISRQGIRTWVKQHYNEYFEDNLLENIKDASVDLTQVFIENAITDKITQESIQGIIDRFDDPKENDQLKPLALELICLTRVLNSSESSARFLSYCLDALKTKGLFARAKQTATQPSYLEQFKQLVTKLTALESIDVFEEYMNLVAERASDKTPEDSLFKCHYLLDTLYPYLLEQKIPQKVAFQFATEMVFYTYQSELNRTYLRLDIDKNYNSQSLTEEQKKQFALVKTRIEAIISDIDNYKNLQYIQPQELTKLEENIKFVATQLPTDHELKKNCDKIIDVFQSINNEQKKPANNDFISYLTGWFSAPNIPIEISLWNSGLRELNNNKQELLEAAKENIKQKPLSFAELSYKFYELKQELSQKYTNHSARIDHFFSQIIRLSTKYKDCQNLVNNLRQIDDPNSVLSLMVHFPGAPSQRSVADLIEIFNSSEYKSLDIEEKKYFIKALTSQMNNGVKCDQNEIKKFLDFLSDPMISDIDIKDCLQRFYTHAPYPTLSTLIDWFKSSERSLTRESINAKYNFFDTNPCAISNSKGQITHAGREVDNGFSRTIAIDKLQSMPELASIFTDEYLIKIEETAKIAKTLATADLLAELNRFKNQPFKINHILLAMYSIEMLHRSKGRPPEFLEPMHIQKPGRSFELNSTQILAVLAMLETGDKVTAEIATGEGKSRITMILNACQFLKGNTVDFLTSDLALAERDYLAALPFYSSLGAQVNLITADSEIEDYRMGGINVSDPGNLRSFRNKALHENRMNEVLNPEPKKRSLTLDEADVSYFDVANNRYNLALKVPPENHQLVAVFPLLMDFFAEKQTINLYLNDKDACTTRLMNHIEQSNPKLFDIVNKQPLSQLERWQDAAYKAKKLKYNTHFTLVDDEKIPTLLGNKTVAAAKCLMNSRINEHALFSDGIHQCLHAELNRLIKNPDQEPETDDADLKQALLICQQKKRAFPITPERVITLSSSTHSMLKDYRQGNLLALSGSIGNLLEQIEATSNFGTQFRSIPRHNPLKRTDHPICIKDSCQNQLDALFEHILDSRAKNQPVLIFCKNEKLSEFYTALRKRLIDHDGSSEKLKFKKIDAANYREGNTPDAAFLQEHGGDSGQIIITSEELLGRGIEYPLSTDAMQHGLKVLLTFVPQNQRAYYQSIGRSGRFGQIGESQMVLDMRDLNSQFGQDAFNQDFFSYPEALISNLQLFSSCTEILRRQFTLCFDDLNAQYNIAYQELKRTVSKDITEHWNQFLTESMDSATKAQTKIESELQKSYPNIQTIENILKNYQTRVGDSWKELLTQSTENNIDKPTDQCPTFAITKPALLEKWLETMQALPENQNSHEIKLNITVKVHTQYNPALAGHVAIIQDLSWGDFYRRVKDNLGAWWRGESKLIFPNFWAYYRGQLSRENYLSQLFPKIIKPKEETREIKLKIPSSTYAMLKQIPSEHKPAEIIHPNKTVVAPVEGNETTGTKQPANQTDVNGQRPDHKI